MLKIKFTHQPKQRFPGDRKWKNEDAPKADGVLIQRQCSAEDDPKKSMVLILNTDIKNLCRFLRNFLRKFLD